MTSVYELPAGLPERRFGYRDNYFQFAFAGVEHAAPHRVRYRYRLSGLDRGWIETDRGSVQYTNLDVLATVVSGRSWLRFLPSGLVALGLAVLLVGLARPEVTRSLRPL